MTQNSKNILLESDIKAILINRLSNNVITPKTAIISEFYINKFSRRVDLLLLDEKSSVAIEIKSDADKLSRLSAQVGTYQEYFDKVIVAAAPKHIEHILKMVPKTVGVWEISSSRLIIKQRGKKVTVKQKSKYIELMTVTELSKLANHLKINLRDRKRANLEILLSDLPLSIIKDYALKCISKRYATTSSKIHSILGEQKKVGAEDIQLLSKYKRQREMHQKKIENIKSAWDEFSKKSEKEFLLKIRDDFQK